MQTLKLSKLALITLALAATACAPAPVVTPPLATPTPTPIASTPVTPPTPSATPTAPVGSTAPVNPNPDGKVVVVSGLVYDDEGAPVEGALITVKSLDERSSYTATANTSSGSYVVNNVPQGVNVEIVASKANWTSRRRVGAFQAAATTKNEINFGTASSSTTDPGSAYFISKYPEIVSTTPAEDATNIESGTSTIKVMLSEALDDTNRRRFEDALRIFPANDAADAGGLGGNNDLEGTTDPATGNIWDGTDAQFAYNVKKNSVFLDDTDTRATVTWNAANTEATLTFNAPLQAASDDEAKYQIALVASADDIEDSEGNQLGTDETGSLNSFADPGDLIHNAFKEMDLAFEGSPANPSARWAATHDNAATFEVKEDNIDPKLTGIAVSEVSGDTRIELTFSEPMAAYDGANGFFSSELSGATALENYTFAVAKNAADLAGVELDGETTRTVSFATANPEVDIREQEFRFTNTYVAGSADDNTGGTGTATIEVDPSNATRVWITFKDVTSLFNDELRAIKARVQDVEDPAGNAITESQADKNLVSGSI